MKEEGDVVEIQDDDIDNANKSLKTIVAWKIQSQNIIHTETF